MSGGRVDDDSDGHGPRLSFGQRFLAALPRLGRNGEKQPLVDRFKEAVVKPVEPSAAAKAKADDVPLSVEELRDAVAFADDKERLTGLLLAPVAAAIALLVTSLLVSDNPAKYLKNGTLNSHYVNPSIYHELTLVLVALAVLMLGLAYYRKRMFLGIVMALYGLAIFNLHYWGFGIPYILAAAWLLVRASRLHRDLKEATGEGGGGQRGQARGRGPTNTARPKPNKRYTPPTTPPKRTPPKSDDEKKAG
ncbi:MAG TPA: hypothetical protein VIJ09_14940 [Acidimicrobiales bacterium]|jgi:hypothetical protein